MRPSPETRSVPCGMAAEGRKERRIATSWAGRHRHSAVDAVFRLPVRIRSVVIPRLAIILAIAAGLVAGEAVVLTAQGEALNGMVGWTADGLTLADRRLPWSGIAVVSVPAVVASVIDRGVVTAAGEVLRGQPSGMTGAVLRFDSDLAGAQDLPLSGLSALLLAPQPLSGLGTAVAGAPGARLANQDRIAGTLVTLDGTTAGFDTGHRILPVPRDRIVTVLLAPPAPAEQPHLWCRLVSGERIAASAVRGSDGGVMLTTGRGELTVPARAVAAIWRSEPALAAVAPSRITSVDRLGAALPIRFDGGLPGRAGSGLVLPSRGEAAWPCAGATAFAAWISVPHGFRAAVASVAVDGRVVWQGTVQAGDPSRLVAVRFTGGRELVLHSDPGADGETGGYAVEWHHPVLVR